MGPHSPRTFAAGRGPGIGRGCWRRVTSWAAACLCCLRNVAAGCLSVPPRLSAAGAPPPHQLRPPSPAPQNPTGIQARGLCPSPLAPEHPWLRVTPSLGSTALPGLCQQWVQCRSSGIWDPGKGSRVGVGMGVTCREHQVAHRHTWGRGGAEGGRPCTQGCGGRAGKCSAQHFSPQSCITTT